MRLVPAASTLITEVMAYDPDVHAEAVGDPDGYGRHRSVRFTRCEWMADAMEILTESGEDRIDSFVKENQASTLVTFVGDVRADQADTFEIRTIASILDGTDSPSDEGDAEPQEQEGQEDSDEDDTSDTEGGEDEPQK